MGRTNFSSAAGSYLKPWILPLVIAAITYAVFTPVLGGEFLNWDDRDNFLLNEHYRGLGWAQIQWMVSTTHAGLYMPLTWASLVSRPFSPTLTVADNRSPEPSQVSTRTFSPDRPQGEV